MWSKPFISASLKGFTRQHYPTEGPLGPWKVQRALFACTKVSKSFRPLLGMQMHGIHVIPVIKGSCLFAKHWNAIWQFCWRQQAQKNNHHLPQKSRSLGREGEECRVSWCMCVCVWVKSCSRAASSEFWNSAPAVQANSASCLCFYRALPSLAPRVQSQASNNEHCILSAVSLCHCQVTQSFWVRNGSLSVQATGKDTKLPALLCRVWKMHHSFGYTSCTLVWNTVKKKKSVLV